MIETNENTIVIVGAPASGKTTIADQLAKDYPDYKVYHTDDYISHGFVESLYKLMEDLAADQNKKQIIEGIQAARLLRKGVELGTFHADLVITVDTMQTEKLRRYAARTGNANPYPYATEKAIKKVFDDYLSTVQRKPRFLEFTN